jgi:hypothetical protein
MLGKDKTRKDNQIGKEGELDVRAPYSSPELRVYGDVAQLTQTAGSKGLTDFGTVMGNKMTQ